MAGKVGQKREGKQAPTARKKNNTNPVVIDDNAPTKRVTRGRARANLVVSSEADDTAPESSPANENFKARMAQFQKNTPTAALDHKKLTQKIGTLEEKFLSDLRTAHDRLVSSRSQRATFFTQVLTEINVPSKSDYDTFMKEVLAPLDGLSRQIKVDQKWLDDYVLHHPNGKKMMKECVRKDMESFLKGKREEIEKGYKEAKRDFDWRVERMREVVKEGGWRLGEFYEVWDRRDMEV